MKDTSAEIDRKNITLLVVDDDPKVNFVISEFLETADFNVISCKCGTEALEVIENRAVDLVLLDIIMPDIDGFTVAMKIKKFFGKDNFVPVIMLTGLTGMDDKITGLEYADDFLTKPCSHKELLARINVMLRIRSLHHKLIASRDQYHKLYEFFPSMNVSIDDNGIIRNCNESFREKTGLPKNEITGKHISFFFQSTDRNTLNAFIDSIRKKVKIKNDHVLTFIPADASIPHLSVNIDGVYMSDYGVGYSVEIIMQDVTEHLRLQNEQKNARKQLYLSARLATVGTLASGVAHELNNPLTAILGFSSALINRMHEKTDINREEMSQYLSIINSQTLRCRDIIENLSKFARESEPQIISFKIRDCLDSALKLSVPRAAKKRISIRADVSESIIARADPNKFEQVLVHVLANCIDFCGEGAEVTIANSSAHGAVVLIVSDNGPGIDQKIMSNIFDPFFTTKNVGQGAGLGLAICHHIMEECGGSIDVISEKGRGTNVKLELPSG
jgi:PAS domain S-box-containing protein